MKTFNKKGSKFLVLNGDGYDSSSEEEPGRMKMIITKKPKTQT